ncbi:MAG: ABC-type transport auxiliary lipoprotein family protein [Rhodospirillales bacterium]
MRLNRQISRLLAAAAVLALAACTAAPVPKDQFYRLTAGAPASTAASSVLDGVLMIDRPIADGVYSERALVLSRAHDRSMVEQYHYHYWAEPPASMLQQQMVDFFRAAGLARQIVTPELRVRNDFALTSKIRRMERVIDGARPMVALEIEFALHNYRDNKLILLETYSEEVAAGSDGMGDAISAIDAALTAILNRFLADAG